MELRSVTRQHALQEAPVTSGRRLLWEAQDAEPSSSSAPVWAAERVVFLNDVYFCARDVVRLLNHDADMACGLDFDRLKLLDATPKARLCRCARLACLRCRTRHTEGLPMPSRPGVEPTMRTTF